MKGITDVTFLLLILINVDILEAAKARFVTCGSVVKLLNFDYKSRLHSHDVKYGTGSGQQSVTGIENSDDVNSHWVLKGETGKVCERGEEIKCGDIIRMQHLSTGKNLHSHIFSSPLSGNQEISAYGDESGEGDTGDHWEVICNGDSWYRDTKGQLRHIDTRKYLAMSGRTFGRPISGQMEVCGIQSGKSGSEWQAIEGIFIHPNEPLRQNIHTEL
ncbi:CLUMA_CG012867, isoform A [Clunio marinus]|uniref:CLUMA_CG012867, isoform A n=1 Tax=Clunio marinus TaxID=568069 RepID=A0A1J1IKE7_9DIPT|nr:CLUMA_CG012867, isoform A [Clunio marinus]